MTNNVDAPDISALCAAYAGDARGHAHGRPWVMLNMIASIDGAIAVDGLSGALGGPADLAVFKTLRGLADVILVASGTAQAERYQPPTISAETLSERRSRGQKDRPVIAVVTRSLNLDLALPLFATPDYRPLVVTVEAAPTTARTAATAHADVITAGPTEVDLLGAIAALGSLVGPLVLVEGGPTLNGALAAVDAFDELCLTTSPLMVGGHGGRMLANGPDHAARPFVLDRAMAAGGLLFTRYLREG